MDFMKDWSGFLQLVNNTEFLFFYNIFYKRETMMEAYKQRNFFTSTQ